MSALEMLGFFFLNLFTIGASWVCFVAMEWEHEENRLGSVVFGILGTVLLIVAAISVVVVK